MIFKMDAKWQAFGCKPLIEYNDVKAGFGHKRKHKLAQASEDSSDYWRKIIYAKRLRTNF